MKEVNCLKCGMQLGEIDSLSVTFKKGVKPMQPTSSMDGVIFVPFECPKCKKIQMETITVDLNANVENGMKVYSDGDSEWYASPWDLEKTRGWIMSEYGFEEDLELEECNLDNDSMWYETTDEKDIEKLGDYDEQCTGGVGDLRKGIEDENIVERLMTLREVLKKRKYSKEPYVIASLNY